MKIILIGYRASGKSTIGAFLSKRLKIPFVDTDQLIEGAAGMPVKDLVALAGWKAFREKETEVVASLKDISPCVVATGGGAILSAQNRALLKNMGTLIYLKTTLQNIVERLKRDAQNEQIRPQFTSGNLVEETTAVLQERIPLYEAAADFTVDTDGKSIVRVSDDIYRYLRETGIVSDISKAKKKFKSKS